ncbi:acetate kinase [Marinibacterium profundimaris]|uniref:Acetate kinase n=1 Tax=Marinibacterium profundimaris TaxID=1679460 RepID=A0A225NL49_9RHOB|nr:acetate kinase [Marinibacterium profundimaris]
MLNSFILTLNAGSSSLKTAFYDTATGGASLMTGQVDRIGSAPHLKATWADGTRVERDLDNPQAGHAGAMKAVLRLVEEGAPEARIEAVCHRIVHGGPDRTDSVVLTEAIIKELSALAPYAPLHQPHNLSGVRGAMEAFPDALQVACFDTAFHRGHPWVNDTFALPREYYDKGVRRYGFHGLSYDYIASRLAADYPTLYAGRVVVAHLGNGASMCGLHGGRSIASTMGFSAVDGLPMGTRTGQLDPGVLLYLMTEEGMDAAAITDLIYRRSGLLGLSGLSNDMRTLEASDDPAARQAIEYFTFRIRRELGGLAAALGGIDGLVFTGGIGEHSAHVRAAVCEGMGWIGIDLDRQANRTHGPDLTAPGGRVKVLTLATDEEGVLAREGRRHLAA